MDYTNEKRLIKRLRQAHYNLVNRFVKEILKEIIIDKNSIQTYAKEWVTDPELQKMYKCKRSGIRLDYLRSQGREVVCYCNHGGNRFLNEILDKYDSKNDYCTCIIRLDKTQIIRILRIS